MTPTAIDSGPPGPRQATTWVGRGLLFVAIVFLLEHARPLLLPVTIAVVFTFVLAAPVRALRRAGVHEYIGAALVVGAVLGVAVLLLMLVAAPAAAWWERAPLIVHELVEATQRWRDALFPYAPPAPLIRAPAAGPPVDPFGERLASEGWNFTRLVVGGTISFAISASATVILLYFMLASESWLVARTVAAVRRPRARALLLAGVRQAQGDIGLFISTMSAINLALGVATGLALWGIGMPNPVLWGTTTAVLAFIPYLGPLLVTLLLLLAGSVSFGTGSGDARPAGRLPAAARRRGQLPEPDDHGPPPAPAPGVRLPGGDGLGLAVGDRRRLSRGAAAARLARDLPAHPFAAPGLRLSRGRLSRRRAAKRCLGAVMGILEDRPARGRVLLRSGISIARMTRWTLPFAARCGSPTSPRPIRPS